MSTLVYTGRLVTVTCWCGIAHAIPQELHDFVEAQHRDGIKQRGIYCPLGHTWIIAGEGEAAKLQRQLERERSRLAATQDLLTHEERSHAATRGHLTRTKRRVGHGVCPCCQRTFRQLAAHMKSQHPDYVEEVSS